MEAEIFDLSGAWNEKLELTKIEQDSITLDAAEDDSHLRRQLFSPRETRNMVPRMGAAKRKGMSYLQVLRSIKKQVAKKEN